MSIFNYGATRPKISILEIKTVSLKNLKNILQFFDQLKTVSISVETHIYEENFPSKNFDFQSSIISYTQFNVQEENFTIN